mmetsp:Transcript_89709/g.158775  ORF Transcript_89709/g.158775 Transcript_89709/m.158775 type:complete len:297 (-) Transcript_89709:100-990(-)
MHGGPGEKQHANENITAAIGGILCCFLCTLGLVFCILLPYQYSFVKNEAQKLESITRRGRSVSCTVSKSPVRPICTNTTTCMQATRSCEGPADHCVKICHQWAHGVNCVCEVPLSVSTGGPAVAQLDLGFNTYREVDGQKWCNEQIEKEEMWPEIKILTDDGEWGCKSYAGKVPESTDDFTDEQFEVFVRGEQPYCLEAIRPGIPLGCIALQDGRVMLGSKGMLANVSWHVQERYSMAAANGKRTGGSMLVGAGFFLGCACFAYFRGRGNRHRRTFRLRTSSSGLGSSGSDDEEDE